MHFTGDTSVLTATATRYNRCSDTKKGWAMLTQHVVELYVAIPSHLLRATARAVHTLSCTHTSLKVRASVTSCNRLISSKGQHQQDVTTLQVLLVYPHPNNVLMHSYTHAIILFLATKLYIKPANYCNKLHASPKRGAPTGIGYAHGMCVCVYSRRSYSMDVQPTPNE